MRNPRGFLERTLVFTLLVFGALLTVSQPLAAQATAAIVGTIRDPTGATAPGSP